MSSCEQTSAAVLKAASDLLKHSTMQPDQIADEELRDLTASVIKIYAAKAEAGMRHPLPDTAHGVTVTEAMLTVTDILHALDVQLFELSMWQAMSGNCIAPHMRVDGRED